MEIKMLRLQPEDANLHQQREDRHFQVSSTRFLPYLAILPQIYSSHACCTFQVGSTDWITVEHFTGENVANFFQSIAFPQREQLARFTTNPV